jgi:hypothetical protein
MPRQRSRNRGAGGRNSSADIHTGTVVRDRRWGGRLSGTVTQRAEDRVFVAWHGSFVEDELCVDEVDVWPDAPAELAAWRGGVGVLDSDGTFRVKPVR